jgi:hypothetical protein
MGTLRGPHHFFLYRIDKIRKKEYTNIILNLRKHMSTNPNENPAANTPDANPVDNSAPAAVNENYRQNLVRGWMGEETSARQTADANREALHAQAEGRAPEAGFQTNEQITEQWGRSYVNDLTTNFLRFPSFFNRWRTERTTMAMIRTEAQIARITQENNRQRAEIQRQRTETAERAAAVERNLAGLQERRRILEATVTSSQADPAEIHWATIQLAGMDTLLQDAQANLDEAHRHLAERQTDIAGFSDNIETAYTNQMAGYRQRLAHSQMHNLFLTDRRWRMHKNRDPRFLRAVGALRLAELGHSLLEQTNAPVAAPQAEQAPQAPSTQPEAHPAAQETQPQPDANIFIIPRLEAVPVSDASGGQTSSYVIRDGRPQENVVSFGEGRMVSLRNEADREAQDRAINQLAREMTTSLLVGQSVSRKIDMLTYQSLRDDITRIVRSGRGQRSNRSNRRASNNGASPTPAAQPASNPQP